MRQLAELLSDRGEASLRYDKVGTGKTGLGPYQQRPNDVGSAVYTSGAKAAARYLADQPGTDKARLSVYALGGGRRARDGAGVGHLRPARRRSTRSACSSRCPVATSTSSPTGCAPTRAPRR